MPALDEQNATQELNPLRPMPSVNFRESLQVPIDHRPSSQQTTYTDRTSRRGSLETHPPHLEPGEDAQIMTARQVNVRQVTIRQQSLTPSQSQSLLERPGGSKKWVAWCMVGSAATVISLLLISIGLLAFFGVKNHSSRVYMKATPHSTNATGTAILVIPSPVVSQTSISTYTPISTIVAITVDLHTPSHSTGGFSGRVSFAEVSATEDATKIPEPSACGSVGIATTGKMMSTQNPCTTMIATGEPASTAITAMGATQQVSSNTPAAMTLAARFRAAKSGADSLKVQVAFLNTLFMVIVVGGVGICY